MDFQAIVRDQLGLMVSWIEGGNQVTVTRDSAGRPLLARAAGSRSKPYAAEFRYDQSGRFLGVRGEFVSVMFPLLLEEAARGGGGDVTATTGPGGGIEFPGVAPLTAAVRNAVQYIVSQADIEARPPRLWPVDAVPYRLFCQVNGTAFGHGDSNRTLVTVDTVTRAATTGHEFPSGHAILDIYAGFGCALVVLLKTADNTHSLYRTTDGQTVELVHDLGRDPNGDLTHRTYVRLLTRGLERGRINGQPALVFATYTGAEQVPGTIDDAIYIAQSLDGGRTWQRVNTWNWDFAAGTGAHTIRHFHAVRYDQWRDCWWIAAGDTDDESCIIRWDGRTLNPGNVTPAQMQAGAVPGWQCRTGSQRWRAVDLLVTEDWIESFTDTVSDVYGGIWRVRPDFTGSHRVDHSVRGAEHDGWAALLASDGTHLWCDSARLDATDTWQRYVAIYASATGGRYFEIGRFALTDDLNVSKLPRGFFEDDQGLVWFSQSSEAGKGTFSTTVFRLQGKFIDERPDCLAPAYFVDPINGSDAANGWGMATAWKTVRNALLGNKVTHGARVMVTAGTSIEDGLGSIEYAANAKAAHDATRPVQISGQGADQTKITLTGSTSGWRGTSAQMWRIELCDVTMEVANTAHYILHDNSTQSAGTPEWTVRDAVIGSRTIGSARSIYPRASKVRAYRSKLLNLTDATKTIVQVSGAGTFEGYSCVFVGGRNNQESGGKISFAHCDFRDYHTAALTLVSTATVAPSVVNCVFAGSANGIPISNSSATVTLDGTMLVNNYYGKPNGANVPLPTLQVAGPLARDETTLTPFEWSPLVGAAQPAGVSWDFYGNPFRARPAIGAVEIPPTF